MLPILSEFYVLKISPIAGAPFNNWPVKQGYVAGVQARTVIFGGLLEPEPPIRLAVPAPGVTIELSIVENWFFQVYLNSQEKFTTDKVKWSCLKDVEKFAYIWGLKMME